MAPVEITGPDDYWKILHWYRQRQGEGQRQAAGHRLLDRPSRHAQREHDGGAPVQREPPGKHLVPPSGRRRPRVGEPAAVVVPVLRLLSAGPRDGQTSRLRPVDSARLPRSWLPDSHLRRAGDHAARRPRPPAWSRTCGCRLRGDRARRLVDRWLLRRPASSARTRRSRRASVSRTSNATQPGTRRGQRPARASPASWTQR